MTMRLAWALYPSSSLAWMIARRVSSRTDSVGSPLSRRDTVACEYPVRFAISLMVAITSPFVCGSDPL